MITVSEYFIVFIFLHCVPYHPSGNKTVLEEEQKKTNIQERESLGELRDQTSQS